MISYDEKDHVLITLDHLACLKRMYDFGIDVSGLHFTADYPINTETHFFLKLLERFFPGMKIIKTGNDDPDIYVPYTELLLPAPEELNSIPHVFDYLEGKYRNKFEIFEDEIVGMIREWEPVTNFSFVYNHRGECCNIYIKVIDSSPCFDPEIEVLIGFFQDIKYYAREREQCKTKQLSA